MTFLAGFAAGAAAAAAAAAVWWKRRRMELGRFFSFAVHEVNTPITAVNMTVLNLAGGVFGELPKEQLEWLEMTREQLGRLNATVGELRDFIHLEFQRDLALRAEDVAPAEILEAAVKAVKVGSDHANVPLVAAAAEGLPTARADADRLLRSVVSLLFHARKFRLEGEIRVGAARAPRGGVEFAIDFVGPELSPEEAGRSLELLYPAAPRSDHSMSATGLGLGIVRELARRQGGDLTLTVAPGGARSLRLLVPGKSQK